MFGIGFSELVVIAIVALIFVGPKRLPEVMKQAGKLFVHVRRTANDVKGTFDQVVREAEADIRRQEAEEMRQLMTGTKPATTVKAIESGLVDGTQAMGTADHAAQPATGADVAAAHSTGTADAAAQPATSADVAAAQPAPADTASQPVDHTQDKQGT
jgi:sec-independent protein translocase protein TatB